MANKKTASSNTTSGSKNNHALVKRYVRELSSAQKFISKFITGIDRADVPKNVRSVVLKEAKVVSGLIARLLRTAPKSFLVVAKTPTTKTAVRRRKVSAVTTQSSAV